MANYDRFLYKPEGFEDSVNKSPSSSVHGPTPSSSFNRNNDPRSLEQAILNSARPLDLEQNDEVTVNGERGFLVNKRELDNWRGDVPLSHYPINEDPVPNVIRKKTDQELVYDQEVAIRYLRPPTPPQPGDIIIKQLQNIPTPPAPPLVVRQQPPRPDTPPPAIIREAPPPPPVVIPPKVVTIPGKKLPPPPRKVVIEVLPQLPQKPQAVIIERWMPYKDAKRRVEFVPNTVPDPVVEKPKNVVVKWEPPQVVVRKDFKDLGVLRAEPQEYVKKFGYELKAPAELPQYVKDIQAPVVLAANHQPSSVPELYGDIEALRLIDLDREGLSEYKKYLGFRSPVPQPIAPKPSVDLDAAFLNVLLAKAFASLDKGAHSKLSKEEAYELFGNLLRGSGAYPSEDEVRDFVDAFDKDRDGYINFDEFKRAVTRKFVANQKDLYY